MPEVHCSNCARGRDDVIGHKHTHFRETRLWECCECGKVLPKKNYDPVRPHCDKPPLIYYSAITKRRYAYERPRREAERIFMLEPTLPCRICSAMFRTNSHLGHHYRRIHNCC